MKVLKKMVSVWCIVKLLVSNLLYSSEFYREFLSTDKPSDVESVSSTLSISEQIKKLTEGVEQLSSELQSQVRQQHGALLSQASHASTLKGALDAVNGHMSHLEAGAERLKAQINTPYGLLENQTRVLARLHEASHLLRQVGSFLVLFRKLQAAAKDPTTQASILFGMEPLLDDQQLNHIEFIGEERTIAITMRQRLNNLANRDLTNGLKSGQPSDQNKIVNSLQIYANLQSLPKCIDTLLDTFLSDIQHSIKECFAGTDVSELTPKDRKTAQKETAKRMPGKTPTLTTSQHFRTKLWTSLQWLFDEEILNYWTQVSFLEKCIECVNQSPASSELFQSNNVRERFWISLEELLRTSFANCSAHVSQCLKQDLPKLLAAARTLQTKIGHKYVFKWVSVVFVTSHFARITAFNVSFAVRRCLSHSIRAIWRNVVPPWRLHCMALTCRRR